MRQVPCDRCNATGAMGRLGSSIAILPQSSLVYIYRSSIILSSEMSLSKLSQSEHAKVMKLGIDFQRGGECSKNTFIRDELALIFKKHMLEMRLESHEVGVHPVNRNNDEITAAAV